MSSVRLSYLRWIAAVAAVLGFAAETFATPPVPRKAPDIMLSDASGMPLSPASYTGKVVLLQFLYTTCPHCQATSRSFAKLHNELGSRGLQVLGIAFNEEAANGGNAIRAYADANGLTFPIGVAPRDAVLNYLGLSMMSRFVVPQVVVIDRNGIIRAQSDPLGSQELMDEATLRPLLERLLAEAPSASKPAAKRHALRSDFRNR